MKNFAWVLKMAVKDASKSKDRLIIYISSIILGIASLVAIQSFSESVTAKINADAKELVGADMVVKSNLAFTDEQTELIATLGGTQASEKSFASMMSKPQTGEGRLVNARALEGNFPFYGKIETEPQLPTQALYEGHNAFVDETVMLQMGLEVGDSIKLGSSTFAIVARITKAPGQNGIASSVAPPVYISQKSLDETGLETLGSRIRYSQYLLFADELPSEETMKPIEDALFTDNIRIETVDERKEQLGEAFGFLNNFLKLVGFIALLLGCVGVASSVTLYMKEKQATIATLRCLGTSSNTIFAIFFLEIFILGIVGSVIGALVGSGLQVVLPYLLKDVLVVDIDFAISPSAFLFGILVGTLSSVLITLEPLLSIRNVPPLLAINANAQVNKSKRAKFISRASIVLFVLGFSYIQMESWLTALIFTASIAVVFGLLAGLSMLFRKIIRKGVAKSLPYVIRQGLLNTARPNNQSTELTISIGLGAMLMTHLFLMQGNLVSQLTMVNEGEQPNLILFDVQTDQRQEIEDLLGEYDMPVMQNVPLIPMRLESIKGMTRLELKNDSTLDIPMRILNREYRVTYRDTLDTTEEIVEGTFTGDATGLDEIPVSLDQRIAEEMKVEIGDALTFNVQGVSLPVVVGSIRKIDWTKMQTNFIVLFPKGVLEDAPQTFAYVSRTTSKDQSAAFQRTSVTELPNVSIIDLTTVLETVNDIVGKISLVIRFMAFICILTGFVVLIGTISNSKFQRLKEAVLLRTIGSSKKQIVQITLTEYLTLGVLSALSGIVLGMVSAFITATFVFKLGFDVAFMPILLILFAITAVVTFLGYNNNRSIFKSSPLEVLRREG